MNDVPTRYGTVAIVGRTNVGKSTFLNQSLGERLAIVSPLPQTTRDDLLGVLNLGDVQIAFTDTPGLHRPKTELGRRMNAIALESARSHDVVLFVSDVSRLVRPGSKRHAEQDLLHPDDRALLKALSREIPCVLMLNKVDLVRDKGRLLPLMSAFQEAFPFHSIVPTAVAKGDGVKEVLDTLVSLLPVAKAHYSPDTLTDKPTTFFARESIREQIMQLTRREVPHAVAVTIDRFEERKNLVVIQATIHVEKEGQRAILIGHKGEQIKTIGTRARLQLEELLGQKLHLELFIRVTERWKDVPRQLQELGYEHTQGKQLSNLLPALPNRGPRRTPTKSAAKRPPTRSVRSAQRSPKPIKGAVPTPTKPVARPAKTATQGQRQVKRASKKRAARRPK